MKIEKTGKPLTTPAVGEGSARASTSKSTGQSSSIPNGDANVHLSATSGQLRSMESSMAGSPIVDETKVAAIKQAISEGRFQVNSGVIADGLIETVKSLISAQKA